MKFIDSFSRVEPYPECCGKISFCIELWLGLGYVIDLLLLVLFIWFLSVQVGDSWPE